MPFIQQNFLFHTRHFTVVQIDEILKKYGFNNIQYFQQKRKEPSEIENIDDGQYIIFVAKTEERVPKNKLVASITLVCHFIRANGKI